MSPGAATDQVVGGASNAAVADAANVGAAAAGAPAAAANTERSSFVEDRALDESFEEESSLLQDTELSSLLGLRSLCVCTTTTLLFCAPHPPVLARRSLARWWWIE